jgi:hypothetical protein
VLHVAEADAEGAAQAPVPAHRHADLGVELLVGRDADHAEPLLQRVEHDGAAGGEHLAGDALAARQPVALPAVGRLVAGGGDAAAGDLVDEVDLRDRAADREVGLAGERVEDLRAIQRGVERARGAGERVVALGLRHAAVLRLPQGEAEGDLVGHELGELDVGLAPRTRLVVDGEEQDVPDLAVPRDGDEERAAQIQADRDVGADLAGAARVLHGERPARRDDMREPRGPLVEDLHVVVALDGRPRRPARVRGGGGDAADGRVGAERGAGLGREGVEQHVGVPGEREIGEPAQRGVGGGGEGRDGQDAGRSKGVPPRIGRSAARLKSVSEK